MDGWMELRCTSVPPLAIEQWVYFGGSGRGNGRVCDIRDVFCTMERKYDACPRRVKSDHISSSYIDMSSPTSKRDGSSVFRPLV